MDYKTSALNSELLAVQGSKEALQCLGNLHSDMKARHWSVHDVSHHTGIRASLIHNYALGAMTPTVKTYNRLARLFGWDLLPDKNAVYRDEKPKTERWRSPRSTPAPRVTPAAVFRFTEGKCYRFEDKDNKDFVFSYVEKRGIHHVFKEIHGGWTRTYTDIQLIGKTIKEA